LKISGIDKKLIDIATKYADVMWRHKGLVLLIICWIYLFWVGTFGCKTGFGILLTFVALFLVILCIINPAIFVK
jgi:hypothetical protein